MKSNDPVRGRSPSRPTARALPLILLLALPAGCSLKSTSGTTSGNPLVEDSSASGAVAGLIGGALSQSSASAVQARTDPGRSRLPWILPEAIAAGFCPTFATAAGTTCTATGSTIWLRYLACSFAASNAQWTGNLSLAMSSGSASCGTFPNPGASGSLYLQFVSGFGSTTPSKGFVTSAYGTAVAIDDETADLGNFDNVTVAAIRNGGYGVRVNYAADGSRSGALFARRVYASTFDHSIRGSISISETVGGSSRTASGSISVYHNGVRVVGTSTFSGIVHSNVCCLPVSGRISTSFAAGSNVAPTAIGATLVGLTETLDITGCGTGTWTKANGETAQVSLSRCD